jgi:hypothetical protein
MYGRRCIIMYSFIFIGVPKSRRRSRPLLSDAGMYIHTYLYVCIYYLCMYIYAYTCMYVYAFMCIYICIYMHIYVYIYICIYICMCIYVYKHIYKHIYISFLLIDRLRGGSRVWPLMRFTSTSHTQTSCRVYKACMFLSQWGLCIIVTLIDADVLTKVLRSTMDHWRESERSLWESKAITNIYRYITVLFIWWFWCVLEKRTSVECNVLVRTDHDVP